MRENATDKKLRLAEVAVALNVTPKLIRNWVSAEEFDLAGTPDRAENKWREYSFFDVAHLAIAAKAIRYGFSIGEAHDHAGGVLAQVLGPLANAGRLADMPAGVLEAICRGKDLYLFKLSDGETVSIVTPLQPLPRYDGALHIDLEYCIAMVFAGLRELGHDAHADSRPKEYTDEEAAELDRHFAEFLKKHPDLIPGDQPANVERQSAFTAPGASVPGQTEDAS
jgi:DNA-binding transcriptional MerR regulator